jgi:phospholipid/cholesterol/gamma-HCH transport system substrate-binding protein
VIRRSVKIQLVAFVVISLVGIAYVGFNYVGVNFTHKPYTVKLRLAQTGGIFTNAAVSERGVDVGRVGSMRLTKDREVEVDLKLKDGTKIPARGLRAVVAKLSAVGEQYVDLEPSTVDGPYLRPGDVIPASATTVPLDDAEFLLNVDKLVSSVDTAHLTTVIEELGKSFDNLGPALQSLIDNGNSLTQSAIDSLPQQLQLIDDSKTVLDTQRDVAGELKSWASTFASFSDQLRQSDPDLRAVLDNGVVASKQLQGLLVDNASALPTLLGNLVTFQQIQQVRLPYVKAILQLLPPQVAGGFYVTPGDGTAHFGMVNQTPQDNPQNPCTTGYVTGQPAGFTPTKTRTNSGPSQWGGPGNLDAYCKNDDKDDQRGARYVMGAAEGFSPDKANVTNSDPYPGPVYGKSNHPTVSQQHVPTAAAATRSSTAATAPTSVIPLPYDPSTGTVTGTDGQPYQLGYNGPLAPIFGSNSWEWLLLAPTMR